MISFISKKLRMSPEIFMFFILVSAVAVGNGLSDSIFANYFKDVYKISALQRGFIEFPRELPGLICALIIGSLGFLGDLRLAMIAQVASLVGLIVLGLFTPAFGVMLIFLFINSMGMHLFMPLQDAIGMTISEQDQIGRRMGQYSSVRSAFALAAALLVFFGFRTGFFTFAAPVKWVFLVGSAAFFCALVMTIIMIGRIRPHRAKRRRTKLVLRKQYRYYYLLATLHGAQKQIAFVYGVWVIVDILEKKADTVAMLVIAVSFLSVFFLNVLGRWMDRFGVKKMMFLEASAFICIYAVYGLVVSGITSGSLSANFAAWIVYALFILDRMSMQMGMIRSVYLRSIAVNEDEVTSTLSMGISLDHFVSITAALLGGFIWARFGSQWVFFMTAMFSLGNMFVAIRVQPEREIALKMQTKLEG